MMNNINGDKPMLPSIKDLLEGGPGLIDYSPSPSQPITSRTSNKRVHSHRRHASEHILSSNNHNNYRRSNNHHYIYEQPKSNNINNVSSPIPIIPHSNNSCSVSSLPFEMQSLSLDKRKEIPSSSTQPLLLRPPLPSMQIATAVSNNGRYILVNPPPLLALSSYSKTNTTATTSRTRTHSRSFSDFTHRYPRQNIHGAPPASTNALKSPVITSNTTLSPLPQTSIVAYNYNTAVRRSTKEEEEEEEEDDDELEEQNNLSNTSQTDNTHIGGGKYICPYCEKGFTRPSSLRTHTYSHTGEKPFRCSEPMCGRKFSVQSNLRRHLRIHRLNKPSTLFLTKNIK